MAVLLEHGEDMEAAGCALTDQLDQKREAVLRDGASNTANASELV